MTKNQSPRRDVTDSAADAVDEIRLQPVDRARAVARPQELAATYAEREFDQYAAEQDPLWEAEGIQASREATVDAAGTAAPAALAARHTEEHQSIVDTTRSMYEKCLLTLGAYRRREPGARRWYIGRWAALVGGDITGVAGAAIMFGEPPAMALLQAAAVGMAAVTAGVVGLDLRERQAASQRHKDPEALTEDEQSFAHLFTGPDPGTRILAVVCAVAVLCGLATALGIFALRASLDGSMAGLIYAALAIAIVCGSFLNCWVYGDKIADLIDASEKTYTRAMKQADYLASSKPATENARTVAEAASIQAEHDRRGQGAAVHYEGLKYRMLRANPGVVGHGPAHAEQASAGPVGRRALAESDGAR